MIAVYATAAAFMVALLCVAALALAAGGALAIGRGLVESVRWVLGRLP